MEVSNQAMDQMLVNTAPQPAANQSAKAAKETDGADFDRMVNQRRAADTKAEPKTGKQTVKSAEEKPAEEPVVTDEQYAIAAAMMFQAQPDMRVAPMTEAQSEVLPEIAVETVQAAGAEAQIELPETAQAPVELAADTAEAVPEQATEAVPTPEREATAAAEPEREAPVETADKSAQKPETERPAQQRESAPRAEEAKPETGAEASRTEKAPETQRTARAAERTERTDDTADETQAAQQGAPLFERVEAPVVKVAEASKPIPLEAEDGVAQLGEEIGGIVVNSADANRVEVTLTPENLGKLTVEITRGTDGTLNVVLHATTDKAANLLEKGMDGLRQALAPSAGREVQIEVRAGEESQRQFLNPDGQNGQDHRQQQQQRQSRRDEQRSAQDFLQQLRLGLVGVDNEE